MTAISRRRLLAGAAVSAGALAGSGLARPALAQTKQAPGVTAGEIVLGQTMPYSGPASSYAPIGRTEVAFMDMINSQGGINGRKVKLLSVDDGYSPPKTVEMTRKLVEQDEVSFMYSQLGTPTNTAARKYLNQKKVPQVFVATGATQFGDRENFPWTIGWQPSYQVEARVFARYVLQQRPNAKIATLTQNDDSGKDYFKGFQDGLGAHASQIVKSTTYEVTDATVDSQIVELFNSGADTLFTSGVPKFGAMAIRKVHDLGWKPLYILSSVQSSVTSGINPAGPEKAVGLITASYLKDPSDPQWAKDPGHLEWLAFMKKFYPEGDTNDVNTVYGYCNAQTIVAALKQCGNDLSRANIMKNVTNLSIDLPMFQPGVNFKTTSNDYYGIKKLRLQRFDGKAWVPFGDAIGA